MLSPNCKVLFSFRKDDTYLDHGGFGVVPKEVLNARIKALEKVEEAPQPFFAHECRSAWNRMAALVAGRFSVRAEDLALVDNVTDGINAVLRLLSFQPDDEILVTSLAYGAIVNAATHIAGRQGARVIQAHVRFPDPDPEQCIEAVKAAITPRTKLAILDHITSGTALVLPVAAMTQACHERGVAVLVDGAHAPGNIALDIEAIKADWYAANLHKWFFVPRGCGFLWANRDRQKGLASTVLSWETDKPFPHSFAWNGTCDPSAWLSIPAAFAFMDRFGEGNIRRHNHALVRQGSDLLKRAWGVESHTPDSMIGSMSVIPLPDGLPFPATEEGRAGIQKALWDAHKIAVCCPSPARIRVSAQMYNEIEDYERLAKTVAAMRRNPAGACSA